MQSYRNLYPIITAFTNLYTAFCKARKGKRNRPEVAAFEIDLEANLFQLQEELRTRTYTPGAYRNFYLRERKLRLISAAPFQDRVVWANIYLDSLDQFVKRELKCRAYLRYADDFLLFHNDKAQLHAWKDAVQDHLAGLRLCLNWRRSVVYPTHTGIPFLGFRLFPTHRRLRAENVRLARQRLRRYRKAYQTGRMSATQFRQALVAWIAHASHGDTYQLRRKLLKDIVL